LFGEKVFLQLWVKVKEGWSDNERILSSLGYRDEQ
jgi:GTP-binding protein Era